MSIVSWEEGRILEKDRKKSVMLQLLHILLNLAHKYNNTFNSMSKAVGKTSRRLALDQRKQAREDLFARNRRYRQMGVSINEQNFKVFKPSLEIDPAYRTLIETLARRRYDRSRILEYVGLLSDEEIVRVYEGMVGLDSFKEEVVSRETEERFMGSGVVPRLIGLAQIHDHPFLQERSIDLLKHLAKTITTDNLRAFFNLTTIPLTFFTEALRFPKPSFNRAITLLQTLNDRSNFIDSIDSNIYLLDAINDSISACFASDQTKEVAAKLGFISRLLNTIKIHFWANRIRFANQFYKIKQRIVSFYRKEHFSDELCDQMRQIYDKQKIKSMANVINYNNMDVPNVANYIRDLIDAGFQADFSYSSLTFSCFMSTIISVKETKYFVLHFQLLDRAEQIIRSKFNDPKSSKQLENCISIIFSLLRLEQNDLFQFFLSKQQLLSCLGKLYEISQQKKVICQLNGVVRMLISYSFKEGVMEVLRGHRFIQKYFKNSLRFNQMTMKGALKYLLWNLSTLKSKDIQQYETIRRMVVNEENYAVIAKIKSYLSLARIDEIFIFYDNMREEEKLATQTTLPAPDMDPFENSNQSSSNVEEAEPQGGLIENRVIQVLDESDDLAQYLYSEDANQFVIDVDGIIILDDD